MTASTKHDPQLRRLLRVAPALIGGLVFAVAAWLLWHEIRGMEAGHLGREIATIPAASWLLAFGATTLGYAVLTLYDWLGLKTIGVRLPYPVVAKSAFLSFAIGHNLGASWLTGGSMRHRVLAPRGLGLAQVAQVTIVNSVTFFLGGAVLMGGFFVARPGRMAEVANLPQWLVTAAGAAMLGLAGGYLLASVLGVASVGRGRWSVPMPRPGVAVGQLFVSCVDLCLAGMVLWLLLPPSLAIGFPTLLETYLLALGGALVTHVPGGLGVFESLMLLGLPAAPRAPLLAALIGYRIVYYLLPMALALGSIAFEHGSAWGRQAARRGRRIARFAQPLLPTLLAVLVFGAGALLLLSVSTPAIGDRMTALGAIVPLPVLEASHLATTLAGLGLIILANAIYRRVESAWTVTLGVLAAGVIGSLLKGWDWEEALLLALVMALLAASRDAFYRPGSLGEAIRSPLWLGVALLSILLTVASGLISYADVRYHRNLWLAIGYHGDVGRFLRGALLLGAAGLSLVLARLLRTGREPVSTNLVDDDIVAIVRRSPETAANLALTGDKRFLKSASGRSLLMYQVEGRSWIAMGDPVGPEEEWDELIWDLRQQADRAGGRTVFYQVLADGLARYVDAGLVPHKMGEEARVDLAAFTLEGSRAKDFRYALRRGEKEGLAFEVAPAACVPALLPELETISREWLAGHPGAEKGFSLGRFDPAYLARFDVALVRREGRIVAFANLWRSGDKAELSVDLMRHVEDAPRCTMRFLFIHLILLGKQQGFGWFNLGMAPLSGLAAHRLAPAWHRFGHFLFERADRFYGFEGLRSFKQDFDPVWRPRYLCCSPGAPVLAVALADVTRLIGRRHPVERVARARRSSHSRPRLRIAA